MLISPWMCYHALSQEVLFEFEIKTISSIKTRLFFSCSKLKLATVIRKRNGNTSEETRWGEQFHDFWLISAGLHRIVQLLCIRWERLGKSRVSANQRFCLETFFLHKHRQLVATPQTLSHIFIFFNSIYLFDPNKSFPNVTNTGCNGWHKSLCQSFNTRQNDFSNQSTGREVMDF